MPADAFPGPSAVSRLQRWRLLEKWLGFMALMLACAGVNSLFAAGLTAGIALAVAFWARVARPTSRVLGVGALFLLLMVALPALTAGPRSAAVFGFPYSAEGLRLGLLLALRCLALLLLTLALVLSTRPGELFLPLADCPLPRRLVGVLWLAERFAAGVVREGRALHAAAASRGFTASLHPRDLAVFGQLAGAHLARSLHRSDRVHAVMLARGCDGAVRLPPLPARSAQDAWLLAIFLAASGLVLSTRWWR